MISFNLEKTYSSKSNPVKLVLEGRIEEGEIVAIHGVSGVGKTTLLRMLAGLTQPDAGTLHVAGMTWFCSNKRLNLATRNRPIGFVFQEYALFPNLTVIENIEYGCDEGRDSEFLQRIINITHIGSLLDLKPANLSGGQQQRVAFARAVARKPKLLLLDEPLSALDAKLRAILQNELLQLHALLKFTVVLTSHSVPEVYKLADRVMMIEEGRITKSGTPSDVFAQGRKAVSAIGEFLAIHQNGDRKSMDVLLEGEIVSIDLTGTTYE